MIQYLRPDQSGPKTCDYERIEIAQADTLKRALTAALGLWVVVEKHRVVYLWHNVRIHLDRVAGLGDFLEFEAVLRDDQPQAEGEAQVQALLQKFEIAPGDLIENSYSDLLGKQYRNLAL